MPESESDLRTRLPAAVYDLAIRLGARVAPDQSGVFLTQKGFIKRSLDRDSWTPFSATQAISSKDCSFTWDARAGNLGLLSIQDALTCGRGRFSEKALGFLPLMDAKPSAMLTRAETMRYLAEIAFVPDAILQNGSLRWQHISSDTVLVAAGIGDNEAQVSLCIGLDGRISGFYASDRPRSATQSFLPTRWSGRFMDYQLHQGRWLPFEAELAWIFNGQLLTYFQATIERWNETSDEEYYGEIEDFFSSELPVRVLR